MQICKLFVVIRFFLLTLPRKNDWNTMKRLLTSFLVISLSLLSFAQQDSVFMTLRQNMRDYVTLGKLDYSSQEPEISSYLNNLTSSASYWSAAMRRDTNYLWEEYSLLQNNKSATPAHVNASYAAVLTMTRAWAYPGTRLYQDSTLLDNIHYALGVLYREAYNEKTQMIGNWWEWRIGIMWNYCNIVSILYDELSADELDVFERVGTHFVRPYVRRASTTYANLADVCLNLLMQGILTDNADDIRLALKQVIPAFCDQTTPNQRITAISATDNMIRRQKPNEHNSQMWKKEGLYADGTFIQHVSVPYIGTYGAQIINFVADAVNLFKNTPYTLPQDIIDILPTWITKTYFPAIYKGEMMLMYMGRGNARDPYLNARQCMLNVFEVSPVLPDSSLQQRIANVCKDMFMTDRHYDSPYSGFESLSSVLYHARIDSLLAAKTDSTEADMFSIVQAAGDRVIHQRENFRVGLSMSSNRIAKYEAFAGENAQGWYTGDGMTYLYLPDDPRQYWQYVSQINPYRIPGTTVDVLPRTDEHSKLPCFDAQPLCATESRAGGATTGQYSTAMMQLIGSHSNLKAKKSWFMFADEVVCLGADISLDEPREVITTIENRQYTHTLYINGESVAPQSMAVDSGLAFDNVSTAYLSGVGGYYFPVSASLNAHLSDAGYNEIWLTHGEAPQNEHYAYVLLPAMSQSEVEDYVAAPKVDILANNDTVQAVSCPELGITAMNFWVPATYGNVTTDGMTSIILKQEEDSLSLAVAEPTWQKASLTVTLDGAYDLAADNENVAKCQVKKGQTVIKLRCAKSLGTTIDVQLIAKE